MIAPEFSGERALAHLRALAAVAEAAARSAVPAVEDPLGLADALAATGAEPFVEPLAGAPTASRLHGARVRGRESGPPWVLCTPCTQPGAAGAGGGRWYPNADGSGLAVVLALLDCLAAGPPEHDVLALVLPAAAARDEGQAAAEAWAGRPLLPLRGVLAVWQVGAPGAALELDVRALGLPGARALLHELFRLGRTLGHAPFAGGVQTAFPGPHVPFLERGLPAVPLCAASDLLAATAEDTLERCGAAPLHAVGDALVRFLRGERAV